ncbi:MAG: alpha/beta hydrolase, partial [Ramlibacter sp.]
MNAQTQKLTLAGGAGAVQALRDDPAGDVPPRGVAVIAHPHPLFGGTMDNKVVQTLARAFTQCGWTAVRFNFRGVGASAGVHDGGAGEAGDLLQVVQAVAPQGPLALAGFSFGAYVTCSAIAQLWPQRTIDKIVLVGTAASRFDVQPLPLEAHDRA